MNIKPNPYAIAAIVLIGLAYAHVLQQAPSFNNCLAIWERGYPNGIKPAVKDWLFMGGHAYCSGGAISEGEGRAWLSNRMGEIKP